MIICYFYVKGIRINKFKNYPVLVIDSNAVPAFIISLQSFEPVSRRSLKVIKPVGSIQIIKLP